MTRGQGNHVSVEFNILYRVSLGVSVSTEFRLMIRILQWHTTTSEADEEYTKAVFQNIDGFQDKPMETVLLDRLAA